MYNYLFGTPALPRGPSATTQRDWLVLGAYPSALHVRWEPPMGPPIRAVAVADEPEPFWDGRNQDSRIKEWVNSLPWNPHWGHVSSPGALNGSSGTWLLEQVLSPLCIARAQTWITDCLDVYYESKGAARRLNEAHTRTVLAQLKIPDRVLPSHPSEREIVRGAHLDRLRAELATCSPTRVVTLGNAALAVFGKLIQGWIPISRLAADISYGQTYEVQVRGGSTVRLLPLAHPGAPPAYQQAHAKWREMHLCDA